MTTETAKKRLLALKSEALKNIIPLRDRLESTGAYEGQSGEVDQSTHGAADATELFERERDLALETDFSALVQSIDRALVKIEEGTYGLCDSCGKPIGDERLKVHPESVLCLEDQELQEGI